MAGGSIGPTSINLPQHSSDPSGAGEGDMYFNSTAGSVKIHNGTEWAPVYEEPFVVTGGTIVTSGGYRYHTFTSSGSFTVSSGSKSVEYLIVAGGGGSQGGGGGAGGYRSGTFTVSTANYQVTVGAGGSGGGNNGGNSSAFSVTSLGGGHGAPNTSASHGS